MLKFTQICDQTDMQIFTEYYFSVCTSWVHPYHSCLITIDARMPLSHYGTVFVTHTVSYISLYNVWYEFECNMMSYGSKYRDISWKKHILRIHMHHVGASTGFHKQNIFASSNKSAALCMHTQTHIHAHTIDIWTLVCAILYILTFSSIHIILPIF